MKRKLIVIFLCGLSMSAAAQVRVAASGHTAIGRVQTLEENLLISPDVEPRLQDWSPANPGILTGIQLDTLSSATFVGKGRWNSGGYVTFGTYRNVAVGEFPTESNDRTYILSLLGKKGIRGESAQGTVFSHTGSSTQTNPFIFYTDVWTPGTYTTSDGRLKSNIRPVGNLWEDLGSLTAISYTLDSNAAAAHAQSQEGDNEEYFAAPCTPDPRTRFGFEAQEVREFFPELVGEAEDGSLGVDYTGFIPLLVEAVKTLQGRVEELEAELRDVACDNRMNALQSGVDGVSMEGSTSLAQNHPNPFNATTAISCTVPQSVSEAVVFVYNLQGFQVLRIPVVERGNTSVTVDACTLQPGMYVYALVADGVEIDSRRMIVTD